MEAYLQYLTDDPAGQDELERQLDLRGLIDRARKDILKQLELESRTNPGEGSGDDGTAGTKDGPDPSKSVTRIQSDITRYILESKTFHRIVDKHGGRAMFRNLAVPLREEVSSDTYAEPDIEALVKQCISSSATVRDLLKADLKVVIKDLWTAHSSSDSVTGNQATARQGAQGTTTSSVASTVKSSASTSTVKTEKEDDGGDLLQTILQTAAKSKATHKGVKRGHGKEEDGNDDDKGKKKAKLASSSTPHGVKGEKGVKGSSGAGAIRAVDVFGAELSSDEDST